MRKLYHLEFLNDDKIKTYADQKEAIKQKPCYPDFIECAKSNCLVNQSLRLAEEREYSFEQTLIFALSRLCIAYNIQANQIMDLHRAGPSVSIKKE